MKNTVIIDTLPEAELPFEVVERKGIGHPDTLCDAIAEEASRRYSQYCLDHFKKVAHHWFDKVMLLGGEADIDFGRGEILKPYTVIFAGKAAMRVGTRDIPLEAILRDSAAHVLSSILTNFESEKHMQIEIRLQDFRGPNQQKGRYRPESPDDLVSLNEKGRLSNDCNVCVGYAPLSLLEDVVLSLEKEMTRGAFKKSFPDTGYDIKIVGGNQRGRLALQVNLPFIASRVPDRATYDRRLEEVEDFLKHFVKERFNISPLIEVNTTTDPQTRRVYLTVTGSVADTGDIGVVGRGNRANGLITPCRPMSIEASSGKNPIDHTGKLFGVLATQLAQKIHEETGLRNTVVLATRKDKPVTQADHICVLVESWERHEARFADAIRGIVEEGLAKIEDLTSQIITKGVTLW